jgi:hypothetical protein
MALAGSVFINGAGSVACLRTTICGGMVAGNASARPSTQVMRNGKPCSARTSARPT